MEGGGGGGARAKKESTLIVDWVSELKRILHIKQGLDDLLQLLVFLSADGRISTGLINVFMFYFNGILNLELLGSLVAVSGILHLTP